MSTTTSFTVQKDNMFCENVIKGFFIKINQIFRQNKFISLPTYLKKKSAGDWKHIIFF